MRHLFSSLLSVLLLSLPVQAQQLVPTAAYQYRITHQVFSRLSHAFANSRPEPQLEMVAADKNKAKTIVGYFPGNKPVIRIDEEVYDLCRRLGSDSLNALAVLLGHELAHHYEKHDWFYTFGIGRNAADSAGVDIRRIESEADFYGCFYGELAGYRTGTVFPQILESIYRQFDLPDKLPGYPSKTERKATYLKKSREARDLAAVFRAGQLLYLLKEFEPAALCFDYLINRFPSREMFNNVAVARMQQALAMLGEQERAFAYPVEFDARSRLASVQRSGAFDEKAFQQLLAGARKHLEKAREMAPDYVPAYVNLSCLHTLSGNYHAAIGVINDLSAGQLTGNAYTARAIALYKNQQPDLAGQDFGMAQRKHGYLADYNLSLYQQFNQSTAASLSNWITGWFATTDDHRRTKPLVAEKERIGTVSTHTVAFTPGIRIIKISEKPYLTIQTDSMAAEPVAVLINASGKQYKMVQGREDYAGRTVKGISGGSSAKHLLSRYGEPSYTVTGTDGTYWVYRTGGIIFRLGSASQVKNWLLFSRLP